MTSYLNGVGIDMSDHHVRIAQVSVFGSIKHLHEFTLKNGLVDDERVVDAKILQTFLLSELKKTSYAGRTSRVTILVPESRVFSSSFVLPNNIRGSQIRAESIKRGQADIPLPINQAYSAVSQGDNEENGVRTTLYLVSKEVFDGLKGVFDIDMFKIVAMDANSKALHRLFTVYANEKYKPRSSKQLVGIVDVGHTWTTTSFYTSAGSTLYSRTLKHKKLGDKKENDAELLSKSSVDTITSSIKESMLYFSDKGIHVSTIMLAGVEATSALLQSSTKEVDEKITIASAGELINIPSLKPEQVHVYGAAIGAAIRSAHSRKYAYQHNFITG